MKKKSMLFDRKAVRKRNSTREIIGLIGTHHGVGVTHTGLMLTFYMGEELGKKTAFLECNNHHDMSLIQAAYDWSREETYTFSFRQISCIKEASKNRIAEIYSDDYDCLILDFGTDFNSNREEFLRCGTKIVIGGQAEWDQQKLKRFARSVQTIRGSETWLHLIPFASVKTLAKLRNELGINIYAVPFEAEPTKLSRNSNLLFGELFQT